MLPFIDLAAQQRRLKPQLDAAIARVMAHGAYVMGPEVRELEAELAAYAGCGQALTCANGTEALALALMAWGVGPGDAVFCPSFSFVATAEVVPWLGAEPVFVDILPDTYGLDAASLELAIRATLDEGRLRPRAVIAVDLFGQLADYPAISAVARAHGLKLIADSAQGFGATLEGHQPQRWADVTTTSFFPAKPLGAYGDGGAVLLDDPELWALMDSLRIHGKATAADLAGRSFDHDPKYLNMRVGLNSRMDTLQAAIVLAKLAAFPEELRLREAAARRYSDALAGHVLATPTVIRGGASSWAQYTIEHPARDALAAHLRGLGVPTAAYYPAPIHVQPPYRRYGTTPGGLPVSEAKADLVLSLPMHADLTPEVQARVAAGVRSFGG